jgi:hypothetical protein
MDGLLAMRGGPSYASLAGTQRVYDRRGAMSRALKILIIWMFRSILAFGAVRQARRETGRESRRAM